MVLAAAHQVVIGLLVASIAALGMILVISRPGVIKGGDAAGNAMAAGCAGLLCFLVALGFGIGNWVYASFHAEELSLALRWTARAPVLLMGLGLLVGFFLGQLRR